MRSILIGVIAGLSVALAASAQNTKDIAPPPSCSNDQNNQFAFKKSSMAGINGLDPVGSEIGNISADTTIWIVIEREWRPIVEEKIPFCARLNRFSWFHTWLTSEQDWNNVVIPDGPFKDTYDDAVNAGSSKAELAKCSDGTTGKCLELEITPAQSFYSNPFFNEWRAKNEHPNRTSPLIEHNDCFYGLWVYTIVHVQRPESHPHES